MDKRKRDDYGEVDWDKLKKLFAIEITRSEAAELFSISRARVSQLQKAGHLHSQPNGRLNFREAVIEYGDYLEHRPGGGRPLGS
jgi:hypothetical protein